MPGMEKQSLSFASDSDPSLLTLEVPSEYSRSGGDIACVAFPVVARRGGLTLAVPLSAFDPEKLVDELQRSEEGLVGPSKSFVTDLVVEDEAGNPVVSEHRCRFLVVDFDDSVLPLISEFNAETDLDRVVPFDADVPGGVPVADGLADEVRAWAGGLNVGRVVFYSAREETDGRGAKSPGAVPKKATQKKITNAMLVEQISQLSAQVQALSAMQQPVPSCEVCRSCLRSWCWSWYCSQDAVCDWNFGWRRCVDAAGSSLQSCWTSPSSSSCSEGSVLPCSASHSESSSSRRRSRTRCCSHIVRPCDECPR